MYEVGGKLLKAVQSFYVDSEACVRIGNEVSEWFSVNVKVISCLLHCLIIILHVMGRYYVFMLIFEFFTFSYFFYIYGFVMYIP